MRSSALARPGDMGLDVIHLNLHKTFSTHRTAAAVPDADLLLHGGTRTVLPVPRIVKDAKIINSILTVPNHRALKAFFG